MHRTQLFTEILDQIEKQSSYGFEDCITFGAISKDQMHALKLALSPIGKRLSVPLKSLTPIELRRLHRREWLEFCADWLTYSSPIAERDDRFASYSEPDLEDELPSNLEDGDEVSIKNYGLLADLIREATIFLLEEETQLYDAAVNGLRSLAMVYIELERGRLISEPFEHQ
jgi:hypothetical protein